MADHLKRVVVWKNLLNNGTEYCGLWHTSEGWLLKGTVVGVLKDQQPMLVNYEIYCDENWLTHRVQVERAVGTDVKSLSLTVESRGLWRCSDHELHEIQGCEDIDFSITPATNTLCDQASRSPSREPRVDRHRLGQVPRAYCATAVPTLHADCEGYLSLRKQHRILS